jgi:hypothetical protein
MCRPEHTKSLRMPVVRSCTHWLGAGLQLPGTMLCMEWRGGGDAQTSGTCIALANITGEPPENTLAADSELAMRG